MAIKKTKRTRRSATAPKAPTVDLMPAGFMGEVEAAKFLHVSPGQLRNYRYRWSHNLPGERGPMFFEGAAGEGAKRIAYRIEDLQAWKERKAKPISWKPARTPKGQK